MTGPTTHRRPIESEVAAVIEVNRDISVLHVATIIYAAMLPVVEVWFLIRDPAGHAHVWLALLASAVVSRCTFVSCGWRCAASQHHAPCSPLRALRL